MVKMSFMLIAVAAAASNSRVFNYWGTPKASDPTTVWGDAVKGSDIMGTTWSRNGDGNDKNGHHGYRTKMGDAFVHTSSTEGAKLSMTNCEGLHSSAKNTNHCLIGGKCGPCPIQTKFPTPAPTPAPTPTSNPAPKPSSSTNPGLDPDPAAPSLSPASTVAKSATS